MINHLQGADFKTFYHNSGFIKPLVKYAYDHVSISVILLKEMMKEFKDFPNMELRVIPNAYTSDFENSSPKFPKPITIVFLSNLMRSKGIVEFLEASEQLLIDNPLLNIEIAGQFLPDSFNTLEEIKALFYNKFESLKINFPSRINYKGIIKGEEKIQLLLNSAIFILPTYYPTEAFPLAIVEAMKTGNTIITTNHNYLSHIISKKNGLLIEARSSEAIVNAVQRLIGNKDQLLKIQKFNIDAATTHYCSKQYITKLKNILDLK